MVRGGGLGGTEGVAGWLTQFQSRLACVTGLHLARDNGRSGVSSDVRL